MKTNLILLLLLMAVFIACKKETEPDPSIYWGEASCTKDGKPWVGNSFTTVSRDNDSLYRIAFDSIIGGYFVKEKISFSNVPLILGRHTVYNRLSSGPPKVEGGLSYWEHDFLYGIYEILEADSQQNHITLLEIRHTEKVIAGTFDVTFIVRHRPYPTAPDTIKIRNGKFNAKLD